MSGRIRSLKPELTRCRELADVPPEIRWTFAALLMFVDDEGRAVDDPRLIKADVYPYDDITAAGLDEHLSALAAEPVRLVCRYAVQGQRFLHVPGFRDDGLPTFARTAWGQRPQKPQPSRYPACEQTHSLNGQLPFPDQSLNGHRSVSDQSRTDQGNSLPQGPYTKDQGPGTREGSVSDREQFTAAFARFWDIYPKRVGRPKAETAFANALGRADLETILTGACTYRDRPGRQPAYTAHPTTWLNRDGWADEDGDPGPPDHPAGDDGEHIPDAWR